MKYIKLYDQSARVTVINVHHITHIEARGDHLKIHLSSGAEVIQTHWSLTELLDRIQEAKD